MMDRCRVEKVEVFHFDRSMLQSFLTPISDHDSDSFDCAIPVSCMCIRMYSRAYSDNKYLTYWKQSSGPLDHNPRT